MGELEQTLGAWELAEWRMIDSEMPIGARRDNLHAGVIAATLSNQGRKQGSKLAAPTDYMLVRAKDKVATGVASAFASLMSLAKPKKKGKRKKVKK